MKNATPAFLSLFVMTVSSIISLQSAQADFLSPEVALREAKAAMNKVDVNVACVTSNGLVFAMVYRSIGLPRPEVLLAIDDVYSFGPNTAVSDKAMGTIRLMLPKDISQVPASQMLGTIDNGTKVAKTTAHIGEEEDVQCVYTITPGTWKLVRFPNSGGIVLE